MTTRPSSWGRACALLAALICPAAALICPAAAQAQDAPQTEQPAEQPQDAAPPAQVPLAPPARRSVPPLPPRDPGEVAATTRPLLSFGNDAYFVKPILVMAGGIHAERTIESINKNREDRVTTVAITRFGLEGRLGPYVSFRSEFERNIGLHGTGIWEGTASLSSRDQFVRLSRWGVTLDGGIILDEASVDFFSVHTADLLLADRYTRNALLYTGFNRGQGLKIMYSRWGGTIGFAYTEANPLSTSTSFMVGGAFAGGSRLYERPQGNFRVGQPDDDLHFRLLSPSLMWAHKFFEIRTAAQIFWVNYQTSSKEDPLLFGYNVRGSLQGKFFWHVRKSQMGLTPWVNASYIRNDVLNNTSGYVNQLLATPYVGFSYSAGLDFFAFGRSGIGVNFFQLRDQSPSFIAPTGMMPAMEPVTNATQTFINAGLTYWVTDYVAAAARVAYARGTKDGQPDEQDLSIFATVRLII